jgi:hypothetical protein
LRNDDFYRRTNIIRNEEELWKKYEEQMKIMKSDDQSNPFDNLSAFQLRRISVSLLEWTLGLKGEKPTEEEIRTEYVRQIKIRPRPQKGLMRGLPGQKRTVTTAWLGWILGIPDNEIMKHQKQYEV